LIIVMESAPILVTIHAPPDVHSLEIAAVRDALFEPNQHMRSADRYDVCVGTRSAAIADEPSRPTHADRTVRRPSGLRAAREPNPSNVLATSDYHPAIIHPAVLARHIRTGAVVHDPCQPRACSRPQMLPR
jgi:hypothetical protein